MSKTFATLLALFILGCGTIFPTPKYVTPNLPKSELAILHIDTTSEYLKHVNLIEVHIDKHLAVRQEIEKNKHISIDDVFVTEGQHDITVIFVAETSPNRYAYYPTKQKVYFYFDVELKANGAYVVKLLSSHKRDGGLFIDIFDKETDARLSGNRKIRIGGNRYERIH